MTDAQLYLSIGVPVAFNTLGFMLLGWWMSSISTRMNSLEEKFDARFEMLTSKVAEMDNRLATLEERLRR